MTWTAASIALIFAAEIAVVGWPGSSLKRLLRPGRSEILDLVIFGIYAIGGFGLLLLLMSLGLSARIEQAADWLRSHGPHLTTGSIALDAALYFLLVDFLTFAAHRASHTKLLWWVHKTHHSAGVINPLTAYRRNPLDTILDPLIWSIPASLLLLHPVAGLLISSAYGFYGLFLHSALPWGYGRCAKWLCSPASHVLHHSADPADYDRNFGTGLMIWDRLFGTWKEPTSSRRQSGLAFGQSAIRGQSQKMST